LGGIRNGALVCDPLFLAVVTELAVYYFRRVVDSQENYGVTEKFLGGGTEFVETFKSIGSGFKKVDGEISTKVIYKGDKILKTPIPNGQRAADVAVDTKEKAVSTIRSFAREFELLDIG
jgi:hypothetical protein